MLQTAYTASLSSFRNVSSIKRIRSLGCKPSKVLEPYCGYGDGSESRVCTRNVQTRNTGILFLEYAEPALETWIGMKEPAYKRIVRIPEIVS